MLVQVCLVPFLFARWIDRQVCMFPARSVVIVTALGEATCERAKVMGGKEGDKAGLGVSSTLSRRDQKKESLSH
jgi:hypothetical protein